MIPIQNFKAKNAETGDPVTVVGLNPSDAGGFDFIVVYRDGNSFATKTVAKVDRLRVGYAPMNEGDPQ